MKKFAALLAVLALTAFAAHATNPVSLGYSNNTTVQNSGSDACANGTLFVNHDGSFENGYGWQYGGVVAPYYGAFAEGYDLGAGFVCCDAFWVSTLPGYYFGQTCDAYVWEGGAGTLPGAVLCVVPSNVLVNVPNWPTIGQNDVSMGVAVSGPFTVGYWGNWPGAMLGYFCAADQNGFGGYPWTNIAPLLGYPTGWNDPSIIPRWGTTQSMGIGAYFSTSSCPGRCNPIPAESPTWGSIKALFE